MLSLRRLRHAVLLAEEQQFARAAARAHLSQPAFSRSIQALEQAMDTPLFDRCGAHVRANAMGEALLLRARPLLAQAQQLQEDMAQLRDGQAGVLRFGMGSVMALHLLPQLLARIRERHPRVQVQVEENASAQLRESLLAQHIDFFIAELRSVPPAPQLRCDPLFSTSLRCIVRADHPLAEAGVCTLAQVWQHGVCAVGLGPLAQQHLAQALGCAPQAVGLSVQCNNHLSLVDLTLSSRLVLLSTAESVAPQLRDGRMRVLALQPELDLQVAFGVVSVAGRSLSPLAASVLQMVLGMGDVMRGTPHEPWAGEAALGH